MMKRAFMATIRFYQRFLSPLKRVPTCRYLPTCSSYALEAIQRRGVVRGTLMALWRILRCNPLFAGGFDPVEPVDGNGRYQPVSPSSLLSVDGVDESCAHCARTEPAGHFNRGASPECSPDSTSDEVGYVRA
jgi:uncharacterized protein